MSTAPRFARERRSKALIARGANASASGAVAALDLLDRPAWMGAREAERESGKLSAYERERLEKIRKNREKLRALLPASAEEKAAAAIARAAQASSALAVAARLLRSAEAKRVARQRRRRRRRRDAPRASAAAASVADLRGRAPRRRDGRSRNRSPRAPLVQKLAAKTPPRTRRLTRLRRHFRATSRTRIPRRERNARSSTNTLGVYANTSPTLASALSRRGSRRISRGKESSEGYDSRRAFTSSTRSAVAPERAERLQSHRR